MAKTKTFAALTKEIEALKVKAEAVRKQEVAGVIARINVAIEAYGLTVADLGLGGAKKGAPKVASAKASTAKSPKAPKAKDKPKLKAKYRDSAGNSWSGRGSRPRWLTAALAAGQSLETFEVRGAGADAALRVAKSASKAKSKRGLAAKFRDAQGNSWGGRGPRPGWVKAALAEGKSLEELMA